MTEIYHPKVRVRITLPLDQFADCNTPGIAVVARTGRGSRRMIQIPPGYECCHWCAGDGTHRQVTGNHPGGVSYGEASRCFACQGRGFREESGEAARQARARAEGAGS